MTAPSYRKKMRGCLRRYILYLGYFTRIYFGVVLCFGIHTITLSQRAEPNAGSGGASISGRITISGKPAAGKKVLIADVDTGWGTPDIASSGNGTQGRKFIVVVTEADGHYRLAGLPAGNYEVTVDLLGSYAPVGQPGKRSRPVTLGFGDDAKNIDFALVRGGAITGRLTGADGSPIIGARVLAVPANESVRGNTLYHRAGATDDRGVYRIYGLPAGRYRVSADGSEYGPGAGYWKNSGKRFGHTYHPNVTDETRATVVEVKEGSEVTGIDINLGKKRAMYEVTGRVFDFETGRPLSRGIVRSYLLRSDGYPADNFWISATIDTEGNFRFAGLPSGRYGLRADPDGGYDDEETIFEVKQGKVSDLEIKARRGATIRGRIAVDDSSNRALNRQLSNAAITAIGTYQKGDVTASRSYPSVDIGVDGSFSFSMLKPGVIRLGTGGGGYGPRPQLLRIERDGVEIPNNIEVKAGETISGIRLILAYGKGIIRGQVKLAGGPSPEGETFIVSADNPNAFNYSVLAKANSKGQFLFEGLMDGEYNVSAWSAPGSGTGLAFHGSQRVRITGGAEVTVTLTLNPVK